jgi:hypothetical protein
MTRRRLNDPGFEFDQVKKTFLISKTSKWTLKSGQPAIQWIPVALSLEVRRTGREADHSPPSSAEVKREWNYTSTPPISLHGIYRDNFTYVTLLKFCHR